MSTAAVSSGLAPTFRDLVALTKPRVTALVVATAAAGLAAAPGSVTGLRVAVLLLGTFCCVASANTLNCFVERDIDKLMARTRDRPLPAGRLDAGVALALGLALAALSLPLLALGVNLLTGVLGLVALASYVAVYTPMKTQSPLALLVGAVPGALPPLMGYTAATGSVGPLGVLLFSILFLWQIPHVIGLSSYRRDDYVAAGIRVLPAVASARTTQAHAVGWSLALLGVSVLPWALGHAGVAYLGAALCLGVAYLLASLWGAGRDPLERWGKRLFVSSLFYLPPLIAALLLDGRS